MGALISAVIYLIVAALVIWIVAKLNLGLSVRGFGAAIMAAVIIAIVTAVVAWVLGLLGITLGGTGLLAAIIALIVAAVVLMISDRFVPGMEVHGFTGAIVAAIGIAVVGWLVSWVLGLLGITF
jgi:putative membrane protein